MNKIGVLFSLCIMILAVPGTALPQEQMAEVRVVQGDTLAKICRTYLIDPGQWREIVRVNRLSDPNKLEPGQVLLVPARMLKASPSEGVAGFLRGKAEMRLPGGAEWRLLALGDRIPQGSFVRTLAGSSLQIDFENGDSCFLRPETTVGMTTTSRETGTFIRRLFLQIGKIITRVQKATGTQTRFEIQTPSAQCAARGTVFRASADEGADTRSEVLEGTVSVESQGARVDVPVNFGTAARKGEAPLPPRPLLLGPVPERIGSPYKSLPFGIDFQPVPKAVSYLTALTTDPEGRDPVLETVLPPGRAFSVSAIANGRYFLHCRAIDDLGLEGLPAVPVEIIVRTEPRPPRLLGLNPGASQRSGSPSVRWETVPGAARYELQLAGEAGFSNLRGQAATGELTWAPPVLSPGSYSLRARSVAPDGFAGEWSEPIGFSVLPPLGAPVLEKPKKEKGRYIFRWTDLGPDALYKLQISRDEDFAQVYDQRIVQGREVFFPPPADSGLYYARVKAVDASGAEGSFSDPQKFRVGGLGSFLLTPCLLAPVAVLIYLLAR